ncbi:unnamed protein product, partial [Diplocarpon coronariae]
DSDCSVHLGL